jgi:hypothetical protein
MQNGISSAMVGDRQFQKFQRGIWQRQSVLGEEKRRVTADPRSMPSAG